MEVALNTSTSEHAESASESRESMFIRYLEDEIRFVTAQRQERNERRKKLEEERDALPEAQRGALRTELKELKTEVEELGKELSLLWDKLRDSQGERHRCPWASVCQWGTALGKALEDAAAPDFWSHKKVL
ncbi:hypothetical protein TSOC_009604 [Tetrabaena socialis]|uniref:Uncharacterized protein n=1 Tax=Tetrabaena socialis TaxID=47790 RepID=A0A2J7ZVJ1_9CHLO|nr:hypothetical protein TSOC_009604 [Tetrabaena socialis]|eukprot:PNH04258.1 hypothetical protein TSOC_009604 [Tetrabaena socialis]